MVLNMIVVDRFFVLEQVLHDPLKKRPLLCNFIFILMNIIKRGSQWQLVVVHLFQS